ncbi:MAG: sensor histidine kinase [Bacteroidota bacterium]
MQEAPPIAEIFLVSALITMGLVGFIVFFVVVYQRRLLKQQREMREQEVAHSRALLAASIQSQENERQRIARDLHDEIGAMLSTVKMKVSQARRKANPDLSPGLAETADLLSDSIQNVRRISHALLPPVLEKFGLAAAVRNLIDSARTDDGPRLEFQAKGKELRWELQQELGLFRVVQELLNNALKHAKAQEIAVQLVMRPDQIQLEMTDDGAGFDFAEKKAASAGLGLKNIESRIQTIGGEVLFESKLGMGTRILVSISRPQQPEL